MSETAASVPPRELRESVDYTGLHEKPGTRGWIITRRSLMVTGLSDIRNNLENCREIMRQVEAHGGWQHLVDLRNQPFRSFEHFCQSPNGFGMPREKIEERLSVAEKAQAMAGPDGEARAQAEDHPGPGRGHKTLANSYRLPTSSTSAARIVGRLKRDRPDVADRLAAGEFKSARAAGVEAGLVKPTSALTDLRRAWKRATSDERAEFLAWIKE